MTIEDKAKAYDKALKVIKDNLDALNEIIETGAEVVNIQSIKNCFYRAFPELKESEDEKIKKCVKYAIDKLFLKERIVCDVHKNDVLAWLKKQGEQDSYNGVSFKYNGHTWGMCARDNGVDILLDRQFIKHLEKQGKQEEPQVYKTKDGEIIAYSETDGYKVEQKTQGKSALEAIKEEKVDNANKVEHKFNEGDWVVNRENKIGQIKALKKDKYNELRYCIEWKDGKKTNPIQDYTDNYCHLWTLSDVKNGDILHSPSHHLIWIYKDNETAHICVNMNYVKDNVFTEGSIVIPEDACPANKLQRDILFSNIKEAGYEWDADKKELKKIEQKSVEWSEEDENLLKLSLENLTELKDRFGKDYGRVGDCINWLKSLKGRVQPQPKQKCSEWDRSKIQRICKYLDEAKKYYADITEVRECIEWLKFLRPQYIWQPSDEQIKALEYFVRSIGESGYSSPYENNTKLLYSLLEQLKKLK